jgi:hypothetical protein
MAMSHKKVDKWVSSDGLLILNIRGFYKSTTGRLKSQVAMCQTSAIVHLSGLSFHRSP